jgi:DNA-binding MarR family transcriptional regulator
MSVVNRPVEPVIALVDGAFRTMRRQLDARTPPVGPLRGYHFRLLLMVEPDGIRLTDLATRASITKQSLGEFVGQLQAAGYLELAVDPRDRRVRIARPTTAGLELRSTLFDTLAAAEQEWQARIGARRWATFRAVLAELRDTRA